MSIQLTFQIDLKADYHISAGSGRGSEIDSALLRDEDGVPVLRGTTVTGLLRDSLWQLLQLQPLQQYGNCSPTSKDGQLTYCGQCPLCRLFGTPDLPKHWQISSARPVNSITPIQGTYPEKGLQPVNRVRINPRTRRAASKQLFNQENGYRQSFLFQITSIVYHEASLGNDKPVINITNATLLNALFDEASLLVASARNLQELGGSRRRGMGVCSVHLIDEATILPGILLGDAQSFEQILLQRFQETWLNGQGRFYAELPTAISTDNITPTVASSAKRFRLLVRVDEPVIIARRGEAGNQFTGEDFVPGSTVLGAFASKIVTCQNLNDQQIYQQFVNLFRRGQIQFSALYPAIYLNPNNPEDLHPTIPIPFDFLTCKTFSGFAKKRHKARGVTALPFNTEAKCPECDSDLKSLSTGWFTFYSKLDTTDADKSYEMHTRIIPKHQRVEEGMLFSYVGLGVGQYFVGEIGFVNQSAWKQFCDLAQIEEGKTFELRLGKAIHRGYGKVTALFQTYDEQEPIWIRLPFQQRIDQTLDETNSKILVLTLLTDTIVLDEWGRYRTTFEKEWLAACLKIPIETITSINVFTKARLIDGFYLHTGLPRERDIALAAGSSVGIQLTELTPDQMEYLQILEQQGLGLRRNEGFGQIVFNHPVYFEQSKNVRSAAIVVENETMKLGKQETELDKLSQFNRDWENELDKSEYDWQHCRNEQFTAIARWLHTNANKPPTDLQQQIQKLGQPDNDLQKLIAWYDVARWLKNNHRKSSTELTQMLPLDDNLIETSEAIRWLRNQDNPSVPEIVQQFDNWQNDRFIARLTELEYGTRKPDKEKITLAGINLITNLLAKLTKDFAGTFHSYGLQMLADRLAAEAKLARKEKNQ